MIRNPSNLLWIIPLFLILSSPLWKGQVAAFLAPRGGYDANAAKAYTRQNQHFIMDDVTITLSSSGKHTWTIKSKRALTGDSDREIRMIGVDAKYREEGESPIDITSNDGSYLLDDLELILRENVVIIKPVQHEEMYTDILHYYDTSKMLISPVDVDIKGPKFNLRAGRMDYDLATDGYDFSERVFVEL